MHLVLYPGRGIIGALIRWQTRGRYGHAATCYDGTIYESQYPNGVKCRVFDPAKDKACGVAWYRVDCDEDKAHRFARRQIGKRYDYGSVLRFITRRQATQESRGRWFCSEYAFAQVQKGGVSLFAETEPWEVSPSMMARSVMMHRCHCPYA